MQPLWRKVEYVKAFEDFFVNNGLFDVNILRKLGVFDVHSFVKDESYPSFKHARIINSRSDVFKVMIGPYIKMMEHVIYQDPWFIKHVPVRTRPEVISSRLGGSLRKIVSSDWTSMEAQVTAGVMEACEIPFFEYMVQNLTVCDSLKEIMREAKTGQNKCKFSDFVASIHAKRMSGEMDTSKSNGLLNMCNTKFACHLIHTTVDGFVEGDDGIFAIDGAVPPKGLFEQMGMDIKIVEEPSLSEASFCGCIYVEGENRIVTDPISAVLDLFWGPGSLSHAGPKVKLRYLRAKALSMAYQYPGCPILSDAAQYCLKITSGMNIGSLLETKNFNAYDRQLHQEASRQDWRTLYMEPTDNTRDLVQRKFGISVSDQKDIEASFRRGEIPHDAIVKNATQEQRLYFERYSMSLDDSRSHQYQF